MNEIAKVLATTAVTVGLAACVAITSTTPAPATTRKGEDVRLSSFTPLAAGSGSVCRGTVTWESGFTGGATFSAPCARYAASHLEAVDVVDFAGLRHQIIAVRVSNNGAGQIDFRNV